MNSPSLGPLLILHPCPKSVNEENKKDREGENQNVSVVLDGRVLEALASKTYKQTNKKTLLSSRKQLVPLTELVWRACPQGFKTAQRKVEMQGPPLSRSPCSHESKQTQPGCEIFTVE